MRGILMHISGVGMDICYGISGRLLGRPLDACPGSENQILELAWLDSVLALLFWGALDLYSTFCLIPSSGECSSVP
jgi:hypothetical protein